MDWRHIARSAWHTALTVVGCLVLLFLAVFLFGAFRIFFLKLIVPSGPVIVETIGRNRWQLIKDFAAASAPCVACLVGAVAILRFVRWINRRDDPQCAPLPLIDSDRP
jgi:hypothetical protein